MLKPEYLLQFKWRSFKMRKLILSDLSTSMITIKLIISKIVSILLIKYKSVNIVSNSSNRQILAHTIYIIHRSLVLFFSMLLGPTPIVRIEICRFEGLVRDSKYPFLYLFRSLHQYLIKYDFYRKVIPLFLSLWNVFQLKYKQSSARWEYSNKQLFFFVLNVYCAQPKKYFSQK